jgi:hypothetical protein
MRVAQEILEIIKRLILLIYYKEKPRTGIFKGPGASGSRL